MNTLEKRLVLPLVALVLFSNLFLFSVTYTNASFEGTQRALPSFGLSTVAASLDNTVVAVAENLVWAVSTTYQEVQPRVVAFLGLEGYEYGQPRYTALAPVAYESFGSVEASTSQVLGISIVNPIFATQ